VKKIITVAALSLALLAGGTTPVATATDTTPVAVSTPVKAVVTKLSLKVGAHKTKRIRTTATSVGQLLESRRITLDTDDVVTPALETALTKGMKIRVDRVSVATKTVTKPLPYDTVKTPTDTLSLGEKKVVTKGVKGTVSRTWTITRVNGKVRTKVLTSETVVTPAVTRTILIGTNPSSNGHKLNLARTKMWTRIAKCESGSRWHINTGNGYYGGLQFALGTWRANGGRDFAAKPHKASRVEQITVANRLYAKSGTRPWGGCA
jgi:uncharacterized protein YabE (DUF348 family)